MDSKIIEIWTWEKSELVRFSGSKHVCLRLPLKLWSDSMDTFEVFFRLEWDLRFAWARWNNALVANGFFGCAARSSTKKMWNKILGKKDPPKFTTRRKYMKIMVDRSIFAICSQNLQLRYGWMVSGFEKNATFFFGGLFLPMFFCVEPFFWAYLELISSQLHQIQWFRRLFLRISMSQVDQAQQNHTSADSQHEKQLWWDWGNTMPKN